MRGLDSRTNDAMSDERTKLAILKRVLSNAQPVQKDGPVLLGVDAQDDAAVVRLSKSSDLVISSDFIRGTGFYLFQLGHLDHFDVGYYLVIANLSDLAAMGAKPIGLTTVIRYGPDQTDEQFEKIFLGIRAAADKYDVIVVGGDTGSYHADVFVATAFGLAQDNGVLLRSGARNGDLLCVTGTVGLPITAIAYFKRAKNLGLSLPKVEEERILGSWKRPVPRIREGLVLCKNEIASACQDISDGLKATVEQISKLSEVNFTIFEDRLPIDSTTKRVAEFLGISVPQLALSASVDFQLLFTMSPDKKTLCDSVMRSEGLSYSIIGEANSPPDNILVRIDGTEGPLPGVGWNHQAGDLIEQVVKRQ